MARHNKQKHSIRQRPRVTLPIRLDDLCLNVVTDMLAKTAHKMAISKDTKDRESISEYLSKNLPASLQQDILRRTTEKFRRSQTILDLLELFEPGQVTKDRIDLLGPLRMQFGCLNPNRPSWLVLSIKELMLTGSHLDQLHKILICSKPSELKEIAMSVSRDSLRLSRIPNILAKGRSLTRVTLLNGADNHTLRILGTSCPSLRYLDVSHSRHVTDQGLCNLLLKRPPRRGLGSNIRNDGERRSLFEAALSQHTYGNPRPQENSPCADTLISITLLGTSVTLDGCDYACKLMNTAYLFASLPVIKIVRIGNSERMLKKSIMINRTVPRISSPSDVGQGDDDMKGTLSSFVDITLGLKQSVIDHFTRTDMNKSLVMVRRNDSYKVSLHMKMDGVAVTSLVLPWFSTWEGELESIISLDALGLNFPNLKFFKGRVQGVWNRLDKPFMLNLEVACLWSANNTTAVSMLQHAPAVKLFEFNDTQMMEIQDVKMELTDAVMEDCFNTNGGLAASLEEIIIRPSKLTLSSLRFLSRSCPKLKKIGDLQSWKINNIEINRFNKHLDSIRSQCVLSVMNFPPPSSEKIEWI